MELSYLVLVLSFEIRFGRASRGWLEAVRAPMFSVLVRMAALNRNPYEAMRKRNRQFSDAWYF